MSLRAVSIAGVGCTPFGAHPDTPIHELALRAARAAIDEAGIARAEIGSLYLGNARPRPVSRPAQVSSSPQ